MTEERKDKPIALEAYEALAERYAALVDTKAENAYVERPATLSLLPDLEGKRVFDAGCGPGVYAELLIERGAQVVGVDASPKMIELAKQRVGDRADFRVWDLRDRLDFQEDASFDVVLASLVVDYIEDWETLFREFARILQDGGAFVFSVHHPFAEYAHAQSENYYATEVTEYVWKGFGEPHVTVPSYRRPMGAIVSPLAHNGFVVERIIEPRPTQECKKSDPDVYERLSKRPGFMCIRARKSRR